MGPYKHILLAADLINRDDNPVSDKALNFAKGTGALLSVVHVVEPPFTYGMAYENPNLAGWQQEIESSARHNLDTLSEKLGIPAKQRHLLIGQSKVIILDVAEKIGADLIIIGSHGRHGISLLLMGSTATAVLHGAKCDVLAVRVNGAPS